MADVAKLVHESQHLEVHEVLLRAGSRIETEVSSGRGSVIITHREPTGLTITALAMSSVQARVFVAAILEAAKMAEKNL